MVIKFKGIKRKRAGATLRCIFYQRADEINQKNQYYNSFDTIHYFFLKNLNSLNLVHTTCTEYQPIKNTGYDKRWPYPDPLFYGCKIKISLLGTWSEKGG